MEREETKDNLGTGGGSVQSIDSPEKAVGVIRSCDAATAAIDSISPLKPALPTRPGSRPGSMLLPTVVEA